VQKVQGTVGTVAFLGASLSASPTFKVIDGIGQRWTMKLDHHQIC
jgi:hypothetical protein